MLDKPSLISRSLVTIILSFCLSIGLGANAHAYDIEADSANNSVYILLRNLNPGDAYDSISVANTAPSIVSAASATIIPASIAASGSDIAAVEFTVAAGASLGDTGDLVITVSGTVAGQAVNVDIAVPLEVVASVAATQGFVGTGIPAPDSSGIDSDSDGVSDALELAFGSDPNSADSQPGDPIILNEANIPMLGVLGMLAMALFFVFSGSAAARRNTGALMLVAVTFLPMDLNAGSATRIHLIAEIPVVVDTDGDGVADGSDLCPNTPVNDAVDGNGCTLVPVEGDAYIFHSDYEDSYYMQYWGDTWESDTPYTNQPSDNTYAKALELTKGPDWGTVIAWGNLPANAVDISEFTHARFKVKTSTFNQVQVFFQSDSAVDSSVTYSLSRGTSLGNGWVEMEVPVAQGFTEMTWFALNFIGNSGTVLLADVYFTTLEVEPVTGPPIAAPIPPPYNNGDVIVLYSDSLTQDSFISVWNANWWNAPIYSEGNIEGNYFAKYTITDGGIAGGVTGLEYGFEGGSLDASSATTWNIDLYVEPGITKVSLQLVSSDGSATYNINNPATGQWISYAIPFNTMTPNGQGVLNPGTLQAAGIALFGSADASVYVDNIYFSGAADFYDLNVTVINNQSQLIAGATVSVGELSVVTNALGVATLSLPQGEHKVKVDAPGYGLAQSNRTLQGSSASMSINVIALNPGPTVSAPTPTTSNADAFVIYSDALTVDRYIAFWSDPWWNPPVFSELTLGSDKIARLQIVPDGTQGGITGIQYGIEPGPFNASGATRIRFDMFATSGITAIKIQLLSTSGTALYTIPSFAKGQWVTIDIAFNEMENVQNINAAALTQLGVQLWGSTSDALHLDNIYFY